MTDPDALACTRVPALVNAIGARTEYGGRAMAPSVRRAVEAARYGYRHTPTVLRAASEDIARLSRNDAAVVCAGSASGLFLMTLAALCAGDALELERWRHRPPSRDAVVVHRVHRNPLDRAVEVAGGRFVEIGNAVRTDLDELRAVIDGAAAVLYVAGAFYEKLALTLEQVVAVARPAGVPVLVDAAGQLPPIENLWAYTRGFGVTAAVFSGGKDLGGPSDTGCVVGETDFLRLCELAAFPHSSLGRTAKVAHEDAVGLAVALELYLREDHGARRQRAREALDLWADVAAATAGWRAEVDEEDHFPQLLLVPARLQQGGALHAALLAEGVASGLSGAAGVVVLCGQCLEPGQELKVADALQRALARAEGGT